MPLRAIARLIQTMLYARRFFPFYVYNILGGIEEDGMSNHLILLNLHHVPTHNKPISTTKSCISPQGQAQYIHLIPWGRTNARHVARQVQLNRLYSHSWITR